MRRLPRSRVNLGSLLLLRTRCLITCSECARRFSTIAADQRGNLRHLQVNGGCESVLEPKALASIEVGENTQHPYREHTLGGPSCSFVQWCRFLRPRFLGTAAASLAVQPASCRLLLLSERTGRPCIVRNVGCLDAPFETPTPVSSDVASGLAVTPRWPIAEQGHFSPRRGTRHLTPREGGRLRARHEHSEGM